MDGVVCLSILLEGGVTVSNNFTKRRQNGFKIGTIDTFEVGKLYFNWDSYLHNFFYDRWFSHTILYIHKLSHTPRIWTWGACGQARLNHAKTWSPLLYVLYLEFNKPNKQNVSEINLFKNFNFSQCQNNCWHADRCQKWNIKTSLLSKLKIKYITLLSGANVPVRFSRFQGTAESYV